LTFSTQVGGVNQTDQGFFYSGINASQADVYSTTASQKFGEGFMYKKNNTLDPYSSQDGAGS